MATVNDATPRRIRDPVHGLIVFCEGKSQFLDETDAIAWQLLNTREFQRLRRIRQLGFSDLVYPGATHSRFAHSIGVYHTTRRLLDLMHRREKQGRIDQSVLAVPKCDRQHRERVALLAALLHDIGHGPFSHVFEDVASEAGTKKNHEEWSAEIVTSCDTRVHSVLLKQDSSLPEDIGNLLRSDHPEDIYATVVSSQFDADRLDYVQRDRLMTGVQSAHIDLDWLFDCLEVGAITIGDQDDPVPAPCLYLNPKGRRVAEEYLLARRDLYRMVYFHKTTRAAEVMLRKLLTDAVKVFRLIVDRDPNTLEEGDRRVLLDPLLRYFAAAKPELSSYLALDDYAVWSTVGTLAKSTDDDVSVLASHVRDRVLFKCVDLGELDREFIDGNLTQRLTLELRNHCDLSDNVQYDEAKSELYTKHSYEKDPLKKILFKANEQFSEPRDILDESNVLGQEGSVRIKRAYVPKESQRSELRNIIGGLLNDAR